MPSMAFGEHEKTEAVAGLSPDVSSAAARPVEVVAETADELRRSVVVDVVE